MLININDFCFKPNDEETRSDIRRIIYSEFEKEFINRNVPELPSSIEVIANPYGSGILIKVNPSYLAIFLELV
jgi:hypothetical protein